MQLRAKCHADRSNRFRDMTIFRCFKSAIRHIRFVLRDFGSPTNSI